MARKKQQGKKLTPQKLIKEKTMQLLHGTTSSLWEKIQLKGLRNPNLTTDKEVAGYFAKEAAEADGGMPIILKVKVSANQLWVDGPAYEEPLTYYRNRWAASDEEWHQKIASGEIPYPVDARDWPTALRVTTCVLVKEIVPPSKIKF